METGFRQSFGLCGRGRRILTAHGVRPRLRAGLKESLHVAGQYRTIPGYRIVDVKGLVQGNTIRAKHVGGELKAYTELLTESRKQATERRIEEATALGANAVWNVRIETSEMGQSIGNKGATIAEAYVYGTALTVHSDHGH